ncbi:5-oxoprolinase subunit PxpA [Chitinophaga sp.]|uniref:5-oxoprolinase subunit PxpA n=1 Tax=Chitinophaga sp. TaxID=1869181 RepID=UPI0031DDB7EB
MAAGQPKINMYIDLNCDMGEGMPTDASIMPYISSANIACGYHAGDKGTMAQTVALALKYQVAIGAHPGFNDKANFGRTEQQLSDSEIYDLITVQLHSLQEVCRLWGTTVQHVKPHGALYNMAARDQHLSTIIAQAIRDTNPALCLFGLSNSWLIKAAAAAGLKTASEVFADRTYQDDGSLTPRSQPNALIDNEADALKQVLQMVTKQEVTTVNGHIVPLRAETICLHGDGAHAVAFAKAVHKTLREHHLTIQHT